MNARSRLTGEAISEEPAEMQLLTTYKLVKRIPMLHFQ